MGVIECELNDIPLVVPKFTVDNVLHKQIKTPLPNMSHSFAFCGRAGSGKSSLVISLLTQSTPPLYKGVYDCVYLFIPLNSFMSMSGTDNPFKNHKRVFHDLDEFGEVEKEIEANGKQGKNSLVIMDDMAASMRDISIQKTLVRCLCNRHHLHMCFWCVVQSYIQLPLTIRKNINHFVIFRPNNKREIMSITEEVNIDKRDFEEYLRYIFKPDGVRTDRAFMYIDCDGNVYNRFNKLKIS